MLTAQLTRLKVLILAKAFILLAGACTTGGGGDSGAQDPAKDGLVPSSPQTGTATENSEPSMDTPELRGGRKKPGLTPTVSRRRPPIKKISTPAPTAEVSRLRPPPDRIIRRTPSPTATPKATPSAPTRPDITFVVNSNNDVNDAACNTTHCSLREAINAANAQPGTDRIWFDIPNAGPHTIQPTSLLPVITDPVIIDGYTQRGATSATAATNAVLMNEIDGSNAGEPPRVSQPVYSFHGIQITAGRSTVRGLAINRFRGNRIEGNFIGTDISGTVGHPNRNQVSGILVLNASNNVIGGTTPKARNVIAGHTSSGVRIDKSSGNAIQGNYIGTDLTGENDLGNRTGVMLIGASNNIIGGTTAGARNVISGNGIGIWITGGLSQRPTSEPAFVSNGNRVQGNFIGTNVTGTEALGNRDSGIEIKDAGHNDNPFLFSSNALRHRGESDTGQLHRDRCLGNDRVRQPHRYYRLFQHRWRPEYDWGNGARVRQCHFGQPKKRPNPGVWLCSKDHYPGKLYWYRRYRLIPPGQ